MRKNMEKVKGGEEFQKYFISPRDKSSLVEIRKQRLGLFFNNPNYSFSKNSLQVITIIQAKHFPAK